MTTSEINTVKYYKDSISDSNISVNVTVNYDSDVIFSIPLDEDNTDYQTILEWVAEGNTITAAD